jgi:hypothetical protein
MLSSWVRFYVYRHLMVSGGPSTTQCEHSVESVFEVSKLWFDFARVDGLSVTGHGHSVTLQNVPKNVSLDYGLRFCWLIVFDGHSGKNWELLGSLKITFINW